MPGLPLFAYGTLQDVDILGAALGRPVITHTLIAAKAPGYATVYYPGRHYPALVARPGASATGMLIAHLDPLDLAVLDAFEGGEYRRQNISIRANDQSITTQTYLPTTVIPRDVQDWTLAMWIRDHKPAVLATEAGLASQLRTQITAELKTD